MDSTLYRVDFFFYYVLKQCERDLGKGEPEASWLGGDKYTTETELEYGIY